MFSYASTSNVLDFECINMYSAPCLVSSDTIIALTFTNFPIRLCKSKQLRLCNHFSCNICKQQILVFFTIKYDKWFGASAIAGTALELMLG